MAKSLKKILAPKLNSEQKQFRREWIAIVTTRMVQYIFSIIIVLLCLALCIGNIIPAFKNPTQTDSPSTFTKVFSILNIVYIVLVSVWIALTIAMIFIFHNHFDDNETGKSSNPYFNKQFISGIVYMVFALAAQIVLGLHIIKVFNDENHLNIWMLLLILLLGLVATVTSIKGTMEGSFKVFSSTEENIHIGYEYTKKRSY